MSLSEAVSAFGVPFLFISVGSAAFGNFWFAPPAYTLIAAAYGMGWAGQQPLDQREQYASELSGLAEVLLDTPTPWMMTSRNKRASTPSIWLPSLRRDRDEAKAEPFPLTTNADFAAICLLGVDIERMKLLKEFDEGDSFLQRENRFPENVRLVLAGRNSPERRSDCVRALQGFSFSQAQQAHLVRWIEREIDFVKPAPARLRKSARLIPKVTRG